MPKLLLSLALLLYLHFVLAFDEELPRIAIVGAGIGGTSTAYYLRQLFGDQAVIDIFESKSVGGRLDSFNFDGESIETGGSTLHPKNAYMLNFTKILGLEAKQLENNGFGIYDGKEFQFKTSSYKIVTLLKAFWRYGNDLQRIANWIDDLISKKFCRLYIDPAGGMEMSPAGPCRRKWLWQDLQCHAPPLQPIFVHLNRFIGMKVLSQQNIQLTFTFRRYSCRMNLGVYMKPVAVSKWVPLVDEHSLYLEDKRNQIESLLDKVRNLLNYSCSPKLNKILPPIYLTNRINKLSAKKQNMRQNTLTMKSVKIQPNIQMQV